MRTSSLRLGRRSIHITSDNLHQARILRRACRDVVGTLENLEGRQLLTGVVEWLMNEGPNGVLLNDTAPDGVPQTGDVYNGGSLGATWVPNRNGTAGSALQLDGVDNYINASEDLSPILGNTGSVSFWLRTTATGSDDPRVTASVVGTGAASDVPENDIFWGYLTANGRIAFQVPGTFPAGGKTTVVSTRPVNDGTWHHIAMTRDTTTGQIKIFVDGLLNDSGNANQDSKVSAPIRNVGQTLQRAGGTNYFNGQIDEFRVDNEALTDQQVALQYDPTGQPPQTPVNPTVAYTGSRAVRVSWTDAPGSESFFEFQVSTNNGATWTNAASTPVTPTSAFVTGLTPNTPYQIRMRSVNPFGQSPYTAPISVTTTPVPANGTGNGLLGVYFDNDNDNIPGNSTGKIAARIDPNIAVDWGTGVPHPAIGPDTFAVQWTGEIQPLYSEPYTFFSRSDDGFFFWLTRQDGTEVQIINDPRYQGIAAPPGFMGVPIDLVAGQRYKIRAEMFEGGGGAGAFLAWQSPSQPYENVPQSQLYSPVQAVPNAAPSGLTAAAAGPFGITLNWTDTSNNEIGFIVERSSTAGGTFAEVARVAGTTYTDPVFPQNTWHYRVRAFTLAGQSNPSNTASATTPSIPVEPGILGSYFNAGGATPVIPDEPAGTRVDATINTGDNHAFPGVGMDGFAIRWEGTLTIPTTGNYTFFPTTDDGVRLWVNGRAASLNWVERGPTEDTSPVFAFTAGQRVPIVMDMYENGGGAAAQLRWSATDAGGGVIVAKDFIPQTAWNTQVSAPAAPTNVATTTTPTSVTINWTDVALNEHSYLIQQSADGVNWTTLSRLLPISNLNGAPAPGTFTISALRPNTQYQFRVLNRSVAGQGIAPVTVTTSVAPAGQMAGTETTPLSGDTNLTTEGTLDWAHWGYNNDPAGFNTRETPGSPRAVVQAAGANYIIWEAENGIISDPDGDNATWRVIRTGDQRWAGTTTTPSGGLALRADDGNQNPVSGFVTYTIDVAQPGTYKLYVRRKTDGGGGDNSMFVAPTLNTSGAGGVGQTQWDNQSFNPNDYVWTASDGLTPPGTTANNPVSYTIATPGRYTLALGIREQNYVIDRVALVDASLQMQGPQLDALVNSGEIGLPRTGGGPISNFTVLGTAPVQAVDATGKTYTWTNGTPNFAVAGTSDAVAVTGANNGFRFTVPASSAARRRVRVYVGVNGGTGRLTATLSDGSAAPFTDTLTSAAGQQNAVYELTYRSGLPTESLTIEWVSQDAGQVILHGVSLADLDAPAAPTDLTATPFFANRVALRWTDVAVNETEYVVLRRTGSTGEFQQIATLPANSRAYIDNGPFTPNTLYQYEVRARGAQGTSNAATASATTGQATTTVFDFQGFPDATNLLINNAPETSVVDNRLRLTNNANDQEGSAYYAQQVDVSKNFETIFDFQVQMGNGADGFVWMLQRQAATALGGGGGSLGYAGIQPSVAIKYDFYDNIDHTGLYLNGAMNDAVGTDANQGQNLRPFGINLDGGTVYRAHIMYINGRLLNTITDVNNPANSFSIEYPIDLAATLGGNMAWIGFSGATGGLNARQEILNWKYADAPAGPADITLTGTAASDNFFVRRSGGNLQVWQNADGSGTPIATIPMPVSQTVRIDGLDGDDTITLDMSGGDITLGGLNILASNGNDKVRLINGDGRVLNIGGLPVINGEFLDLGTADLKLTGVQASAVEALLASARNGTPRWQGPGIGTSAAGTDTGLAPVQQGGDTLVKFTWNGDVNGDGRINADDYFEIDSGFLDPPADPTYADGDFNFDNRINADDYFLIDSAFLGQTGILSSSSAASAVTSTSATPAIPDNQGTKRAKRVANANSALFGSTRIEKKVRRARG